MQADLLPGARCELAYLDYGPMRLRLAVDKMIANSSTHAIANSAIHNETDKLADLPAQLLEIEADLRAEAKKSGSIFNFVEMADKPDWVVQARQGELTLLPADVANIQGALPPRAPRFPLPGQRIGKALQEYSQRIFRAQNLLKLTAPSTELPHPAIGADGLVQDDSAICVEVEMLKFPKHERSAERDDDDRQVTPLRATGGELVVRPGQSVGWRITNHSRFKVDVTLLFVDSEYGIESIFPLRRFRRRQHDSAGGTRHDDAGHHHPHHVRRGPDCHNRGEIRRATHRLLGSATNQYHCRAKSTPRAPAIPRWIRRSANFVSMRCTAAVTPAV